MNRRAFITVVAASAAAPAMAAQKPCVKPERLDAFGNCATDGRRPTPQQPDAEVIFLVKAELKCTAEQARIVEVVLNGLGREFGEDTYIEDWKISKKIYGAWEK